MLLEHWDDLQGGHFLRAGVIYVPASR